MGCNNLDKSLKILSAGNTIVVKGKDGMMDAYLDGCYGCVVEVGMYLQCSSSKN